jgi:MoxR-like ATPase
MGERERLDTSVLHEAATRAEQMRHELTRAFIGSPAVLDLLVVALVAGGHVLVEGVPGVAKTTLIKAFAAILGCGYRRIQFTPDLLPADITGSHILSPSGGGFVLREGPIFANILLGDEINRAPAKTQSALLEAMQENQVTLEGDTRPLPRPFMVLATQNPLELAGTYPLPEAQVDRFLMKVEIGYPTAGEEKEILRAYSGASPVLGEVLGPEEILRLQELTRQVHIDDELLDYIIALAGYTRQHHLTALGASPRACLQLMYAARAQALLKGRDYVLPDDIKALARPVLAHRLVLTPDAELDGVPSSQLLDEALAHVAHRRTFAQ